MPKQALPSLPQYQAPKPLIPASIPEGVKFKPPVKSKPQPKKKR